MRYPGRDNNENAHEPEDDEDESEDRNEEIEQTYRNQYWLRIVSLQNHQEGIIERSPLAADIIECLNEID